MKWPNINKKHPITKEADDMANNKVDKKAYLKWPNLK